VGSGSPGEVGPFNRTLRRHTQYGIRIVTNREAARHPSQISSGRGGNSPLGNHIPIDVLKTGNRGENHRCPVVQKPGVEKFARGFLRDRHGVNPPNAGPVVKTRHPSEASHEKLRSVEREQPSEGRQPGRWFGSELAAGKFDELVRARDK
jgi:hypothetical protein